MGRPKELWLAKAVVVKKWTTHFLDRQLKMDNKKRQKNKARIDRQMDKWSEKGIG